MDVDYYSLLSKAVAGKDGPARDKIYHNALGLIRNSPNLTREAAASHAAALKAAVRRIEDELAADDAASAADISAVLSTSGRRRPLSIAAAAVVALIAVSALLYSQFASRGPIGAGMTAAVPKASRGKEEAV